MDKTAWKSEFETFSTQKSSDWFIKTILNTLPQKRARKNVSEFDTHQLELNSGLNGTAQTNPQEKDP